jgi:hypothetical protein
VSDRRWCNIPRAGLVAAGIEAWMMAKAIYGAQNGLKASFGGWSRARL